MIPGSFLEKWNFSEQLLFLMTVTNMNTLVIETVLTLSDQESIEIQHTPCKEQEKGVDEKLPGLIVMDSPNSTAPPTPSESFYNTSEIESLQNEMTKHDINERNNNCDCLFPPLTTTTTSLLNENLQDDSIIKSKQEQGTNKNSGEIEYTDKDIANEATSISPSDESQNIDETKINNNDSNDDDDDDSVVLGPVEFFRKSIVAVTGTAMLGVGAVLVPAPVPLGIPVIAGGLALLSTEFPESVDKITETTRQKLVDVLEKDADKDDEEEHENQVSNEDNDNSLESSSKETTPVNNNDTSNGTFQENFNKTKRDIQKNVRNKLLPWLRKDSPKQEVSSLNETNSTTNEGN